jgi:hypothetical protein
MQIRELMGLLVMALILLAGCAAAEVRGATSALSPNAGMAAEQASNQALERRLHLAALFDAAILDQTVYHKYDQIIVRWPQDMALSGEITLRIQKPDGRIYGERHAQIEAGSVINLGEAYILRDGHYHIVLMPPVTEYYMGGIRLDKKLDIEVKVWQP